MGKSTNGPDWTDCSLYLKEISDTNHVCISLLLECDGYGAGPRWRIYGWTSEESVPLAEMQKGVGASVLWPHREHRTMEGAIFFLLSQLDALLGREEFLRKTLG